MILCDRNILELRDSVKKSSRTRLLDAEKLLAKMSYELIPAIDYTSILNAAIIEDVDISNWQ